MGLLVSVFLSGCGSTHQQTTDIMIVDGCIIEIKGLSHASASDIQKNWSVDENCVLNTNSRMEGKDIK